MPLLFWDVETRSACNLKIAGAHRYAADRTTEVWCVAYAVDDEPTQLWTPGQPVPGVFFTATSDPNWRGIAHNYAFERAISKHILEPQYGWPPIPLNQQICTMSMALAAALPASLDTLAKALDLPFKKDGVGHQIMLRLCKPRKPRKSEAKGIYWHNDLEDIEKLQRYCMRDVDTERAAYYRLPLLSPDEHELWQLDANINARGFATDVALAQAAYTIAREERATISAEIKAITNGAVVSVDQVEKIKTFIRERGTDIEALTKHSVTDLLASTADDSVRRLLQARQDGAKSSAAKLGKLLAQVGTDRRVRGGFRYHGAATGRFSGQGFQPQNLKKPKTKDLDTAIDAILAGDRERVREIGSPLAIAGDISRGLIVAAEGHVLMGADYSSIESRVLAGIAGEEWKLDAYRKFDATQDPTLEPYCVTATRILRRNEPVTPADKAARQIGKTCDLAFGYGGGLGAFRKFDRSDTHTDADVERFKNAWRDEHPATVRFWRQLQDAAHRAIITGLEVELDGLFFFKMESGALFLTLPSGRRLAYPEARLGPGKFEGHSDIISKNNAQGRWADHRAWRGLLVENVVQAISRDLMTAAMLRIEAAGYPIVMTVHDEVVCEIPEGFGSEDEFQRLMEELPEWAAGLPVVAKPWTRKRYAETTVESAPAAPIKNFKVHIDLPLDEIIPETGEAISCPFHEDDTPSLRLYEDHYHCFGCGAHGDLADWLVKSEGLDRREALRALKGWEPEPAPMQPPDAGGKEAFALQLWDEAKAIAGTLASRYLSETRNIDVAELPAGVDLRFHPRCPFGSGMRHPCLLALLRNPISDAPTGIQRIALTPDAQKIDRRMLGRAGVVKLWPAGEQLVIGEGLETVLAAATRITHRGEHLRPAWATMSAGALGRFPVIAGVARLIVLADHDPEGWAATNTCIDRWQRAGRTVVRLKPKRAGADFNDLVMPAMAP